MEIVNIQYTGFGSSIQKYNSRDLELITNNTINNFFEDGVDSVEYFITDESKFLLDYRYDAPYKLDAESNIANNKYSRVIVDPEADVKSMGYNRGIINIQYNFLRYLFNSNSTTSKYWIKEISNSRLELKLASQDIPSSAIVTGFNQFENYITQKNYYPDFYLNFGRNNLIIAVNALVITEEDGTSYLLIKLYEPLPLDIDLKSQLSIAEKIGNSVSYKVDIQVESDFKDLTEKLRGPNFNISNSDTVGQTTQYYSYNNLFSANVSSSIRQLMSYYEDKAISINVDYSNFNNFIHFSSAEERISNFVYKLGLIEDYNTQINLQSSITGSSNSTTVSSSINLINTYISNVIEKFDPYEYYLYYASESFAWPKSTSSKPYSLYSVTSSKATNWLGSKNTLPSSNAVSILYSASLYDDTNKDLLRLVVPTYLRDDPNNAPYITFIDMIGQYFDNIWIYYKDITNRYDASNNPYSGISLDFVADALKGLGIELYTNTNLSNDIYYTLFGFSNSNSLLPPTGSEKINTFVTSSISESGTIYTLPYDQIQKELYKRIYHNLPYLLKTKGTSRGVKALIACYGIPSSILTVNEFGGYDRSTISGLDSLNNDRINIVSQSSNLYLSESILSPYTTIQNYTASNRLGSFNLEVGFSPSDKINSNISSSLGYINIDNLIGNPTDLYSSSYSSLDSYRNSYFSSYDKKSSIWEYIRLIKYYNNSLFKMVKDFVPAKSSISTGIIIKPHILERSKYARHEPIVTLSNYSQSIDILNISAYAATSYSIDTVVRDMITSSIGYIPVTRSSGFENFTGEFSGTEFIATSLNSVGNQTERSKNALTASTFNYGALLNNVTASVRSIRFLDLDYTSNAINPINFGAVTKSLADSITNNFNTYTNPNNPYAELQDFNYFSQRSTIPRYFGSKVQSSKYNVYTLGDQSFGNSPAIDHRSLKLGLFTQIRTSSFFPGQVNATLTYLVDRASGLQELNLLNNNWFEVQNTFKAGETLTIKQFDNKKYSNQKVTDGIKSIYESGYSYTPTLYYQSGSDSKIYFDFINAPIAYVESNNQYNNKIQNTITGSLGLVYPFIKSGVRFSGSIYNIFDNESSDENSLFTIGNSSSLTYPTYSVAYAGNYNINANFNMYLTASATTDSASFILRVKKNGTLIATSLKTFTYSAVPPTDSYFYVTLGFGS